MLAQILHKAIDRVRLAASRLTGQKNIGAGFQN